jgi:hypothetical protein
MVLYISNLFSIDKSGFLPRIQYIIIIIIINIKGWAIWPVPSPELQLLLPAFLRSSDCSLSLWTVVV